MFITCVSACDVKLPILDGAALDSGLLGCFIVDCWVALYSDHYRQVAVLNREHFSIGEIDLLTHIFHPWYLEQWDQVNAGGKSQPLHKGWEEQMNSPQLWELLHRTTPAFKTHVQCHMTVT